MVAWHRRGQCRGIVSAREESLKCAAGDVEFCSTEHSTLAETKSGPRGKSLRASSANNRPLRREAGRFLRFFTGRVGGLLVKAGSRTHLIITSSSASVHHSELVPVGHVVGLVEDTVHRPQTRGCAGACSSVSQLVKEQLRKTDGPVQFLPTAAVFLLVLDEQARPTRTTLVQTSAAAGPAKPVVEHHRVAPDLCFGGIASVAQFQDLGPHSLHAPSVSFRFHEDHNPGRHDVMGNGCS